MSGIQVDWPQFATALANLLRTQESEVEDGFKETFRVFSKDDKGCIPAEEIKFVLSQVCSEAVRINILQLSQPNSTSTGVGA